MENLPYDLLREIARLLDPCDIARFRLVSRLLARVGVEHLNVDKPFCFRKDSLDRLQSIARHPLVRRRLFEIRFFVDVLPSYDSREAWETQASAICHTDKSRGTDLLADRWLQKYKLNEAIPLTEIAGDDGDDFKTAGWKDYQTIRKEQEELLESCSTLFEELRQDLALLPGLRTFELESFEKRYEDSKRSLFVLNNRQDWYCYNQTCAPESFLTVSRGLLHAILSRRNLDNDIEHSLDCLGANAVAFTEFGQQLPDIALWKSSLEEVKMLRVSLSIRDQLDLNLEPNTCSETDTVSVKGNREHGWQRLEQSLRPVLVNVRKLESLTLEVSCPQRFPTQQVFRDFQWPLLSFVCLFSVEIDVPSFENFLSMHADSLEHLMFGFAKLTGTSVEAHGWISFLKFIGQTLSLSRLRLFGTFQEDHHAEVVTFDSFTCYHLDSGKSISVFDMANFLVCGHCPDRVVDEFGLEELLKLTWQDLNVGYRTL